jgi:hypothetical protein
LIGAGGAAFSAYRRSRPTTDPWADPWEPATATPSTTTNAQPDLQHRAAGAAEAVGEAAGASLAKTREATRKAAERAAELRGGLTEKVGEAREKIATRRHAADTGTSTDGAPDPLAESGAPLTTSADAGLGTEPTLGTTGTVGSDAEETPSEGAKNAAGQWGSGQPNTES